ncbi:MAG TPA: response regulator [Candidatus Paceibacterota bacterium]|nr:response regulator [Candidatus Paceibacterota bacterium]
MKKVLVIEDEALIADLLSRRLQEKGYYAFLAEDGEKGLQFIRKEAPDLVLLDIVLPRLNGFEVLEELQKEGLLSRIPVIIISNSGQPAEIERAKEAGVVDWLIKTEFDPQEVIEKVEKQIGPGDLAMQT